MPLPKAGMPFRFFAPAFLCRLTRALLPDQLNKLFLPAATAVELARDGVADQHLQLHAHDAARGEPLDRRVEQRASDAPTALRLFDENIADESRELAAEVRRLRAHAPGQESDGRSRRPGQPRPASRI